MKTFDVFYRWQLDSDFDGGSMDTMQPIERVRAANHSDALIKVSNRTADSVSDLQACEVIVSKLSSP